MSSLEQEVNLGKLGFGDYICLLFDDMKDYRYIACKFIRDGLIRNEKILFIIDEYPKGLLIEDLKAENIDVDQYINNGQLVIASNENMYSGNYGFNVDEAINNWKQQLKIIKNENFSGFRAMGEMLFAAGEDQETINKLMEYEVWVHKEVAEIYDRQINLCIFNKAKFPNYVLEYMIEKHKVVINNRELMKPNPYYIDPDNIAKKHLKKIKLRKRFSLNPNDYNKQDNIEKDRYIEILKHVLSATGDGIWELNIQTREIDISENFYHILGIAGNKSVIEYKAFLKIMHPEDSQEFNNSIQKCCNYQDPYFSNEIRVRKRNDEWIWLLIKGVPIINDATSGKVLKLVGIFNNITDNKKLKRELEEKIYSEKVRTDFFANISHELRTPLNVILGSLQLQELYINKDPSNGNLDKYKRQLRIMKMNGYRLLRLVNNLIDITRIDSGFYSIDLENHDIVNIVRNIIISVEDYIKKQNLSVNFHSSIDNLIVACDPDKIERVIMNLLSNAIKFSRSGGKITVNLSRDDTYVFISVKDTGIGIPGEKLKDIFKRFEQVDNTLTRKHEGSGIGLSLAKSIVEMHEGRIWVESELNKGSRFISQLPIRVVSRENQTERELPSRWMANVERMYIEFSDIYSMN